MNTRRTLRLLALIPWLALCAAAASQGSRPPNFVIMLADDLGWADLGVYGADLHETPQLDRFAASAMRFTNAYAASPVCTPTRASIMTGKWPARLHMTIWREATLQAPPKRKLTHAAARDALPHDEVTIAEVLQQAGYLTAHVGKWHLGTALHYPETQGFDVHIGGSLWGAPQSFFYPYRGSKHFGGEPRYVPGLHWGQPGEYLTDRLTDEALAIIDRAGRGPFFLNLCYYTVHTPIEGKPDLVRRFEARLRPGMNHQNATYAAMAASLDENAGRVLAKLEERGLAGNTVVIFASDNGGFINQFDGQTVTNNHPLRSGKGALYEGGVRVPFIVRWPGVTKPGTVSDEPVCTTDLYPTMLDMAGLSGDAAHRPDGVSIAPLLRGSADRLDREALYFHYPHYYQTTTPVSSIRAGDWKLLEYYEDNHVELYNLADDPGEATDLASTNPAKAEELRERLHQWLRDVDAQLPRPNPEAR